MNDKLKKTLICVGICSFVLMLVYSGYVNFRLERKLANLSESIASCQSTTAELREGIRRQEQLLDNLGQLSNQLTDTVEGLTATESNIDGYTGAVRGTIDNVTRTIELTLEGLEQEGITE